MSDNDVESYLQIKADLDTLRQSVEKSELWVFKSKFLEDQATKTYISNNEEKLTRFSNNLVFFSKYFKKMKKNIQFDSVYILII